MCNAPGTPELVQKRRAQAKTLATNRAGRVGSASRYRRRTASQFRVLVAMYVGAVPPNDVRMGDRTTIYDTKRFWSTADERQLGALPVLLARVSAQHPLCLPALPWHHMGNDLVQTAQCLEIISGLRTTYYVGKRDVPWSMPELRWVQNFCREDIFMPTQAGLRLPRGWIRGVYDALIDLDRAYRLSAAPSHEEWFRAERGGQLLLRTELVEPLRAVGWPVERLPAVARQREAEAMASLTKPRKRRRGTKRTRDDDDTARSLDVGPVRRHFTMDWDDKVGVRGRAALTQCVDLFQRYLPSCKTSSQRELFDGRIRRFQSQLEAACSSSSSSVDTA